MLRALAALVLIGLIVMLAKTALDSHGVTAAERQRAAENAATQRAELPPLAKQKADCLKVATAKTPHGPSVSNCQQLHDPTAEDFLPDHEFHFSREISSRITAFGIVLGLFGFVVGAGYAGAEWSAGTLAALLTWEPRRLRVLGAKVAALTLVVGAVGLVVMTVDVAGHYGVAAWRGDAGHVNASLVGSIVLAGLRAVVVGVMAALVGQALAGLLRNNAAALAVGFAYAIGGEGALRALWKGSDHWLLSSHVTAWLDNGTDIFRSVCPPDGGRCTQDVFHITLLRGGIYLAVVVLVIGFIDATVFHRRDIT
jgi:hypothetical protein